MSNKKGMEATLGDIVSHPKKYRFGLKDL